MSFNLRNALSNAFVGSGGGTFAGGTLTSQLIQSTNGAASTPPVLLSGTIFTGGSATTTKPQLLVEPSGTTSTGWSTSGTLIGANAPSGFVGNLLDLQLAAASKFKVSSTGTITLNNLVSIGNGAAATLSLDLTYSGGRRAVFAAPTGASSGLHFYFEDVIGWTGGAALAGGAADDLVISRAAAASLQLGANHATTATDQTFKAHNVTTGTGAALTLAGGTGSVAGGVLNLSTSATTGAPVTHLQIKASGVVNFASASVVTESVTSDRTLAIEVGGTTYKVCLKA